MTVYIAGVPRFLDKKLSFRALTLHIIDTNAATKKSAIPSATNVIIHRRASAFRDMHKYNLLISGT